jgi:DNA excision repair protein ERCC-4
MYLEGGCLFVTSRILIVDLLDEKIDPKKIKGLLIYNAHRISETSVESFIIRVFKQGHRNGFIKAFSDDAESLQMGFGKVERLLKLLYMKKLYLWPRFRLEVANVLNARQPEVIELSVSLTKNMTASQSAILVSTMWWSV